MLVLLTILVVVSTACSLAVLFKNRQTKTPDTHRIVEPPPYRSLFAPSEEEIRAFERAEATRLETQARENERRRDAEKIDRAREFQNTWRDRPDRQNSLRLLRLAAESGDGPVFAEAAGALLESAYENTLTCFSKQELAELLDSHFRLLPQQERTPGAIFRLKEEIAELRRPKSEAQFDRPKN
jgi:hypothetical protein